MISTRPKPRQRFIRRVSTARAARLREYSRERKFFLADNPWCAWGLAQSPPIKIRSTEVHHLRGRVGKLLLDQRFWRAVSAEGHDWIHRNIKLARERGLICDYGHWNQFPSPALSNRQVANAPVNGRAAAAEN